MRFVKVLPEQKQGHPKGVVFRTYRKPSYYDKITAALKERAGTWAVVSTAKVQNNGHGFLQSTYTCLRRRGCKCAWRTINGEDLRLYARWPR